MHWIDERAVMAHELGAARFLLEHFMAGTANAQVRREAQAWLDRARGAELRTGQTGQTRSSEGGKTTAPGLDRPDQAGRSGSPFDWLGQPGGNRTDE